MKLRSLLSLCFFVAACSPPAPAVDAGSDAQPDAIGNDAAMDASPADASPADASPVDASPADASVSNDAAMDASPADSSIDGSSPASCCLPLPGASASFCAGLASLGRDRCNMVNGGTSCSWSPSATCNDGGAPPQDAAPPADAGCCRALPGVSQAQCDPLNALGQDRCNMISGGTLCLWTCGG
jgi:hypothetical protein